MTATQCELLAPPTQCTRCCGPVGRWNRQYLCKQCGASWTLIRNERAENLAMLWFFGAIAFLAFVPLVIGLMHLAVATISCGVLAVRLRRQHRYQLVPVSEKDVPPSIPEARALEP